MENTVVKVEDVSMMFNSELRKKLTILKNTS